MKINFFALIAAGLATRTCALECTTDLVTDEAALAELVKYEKELAIDPLCLGEPPLPVNCNYMGLAQDCSSCFMTCEGAQDYMDDTRVKVEEWGAFTSGFPDIYLNFCPTGEVEAFDDCYADSEAA